MKKLLLGIASGGLIAALLHVSYAAIPAADGRITGCYRASDGNVRIIDTELRGIATQNCIFGEQKISWAAGGIAGGTGAIGLAGPQGNTGATGPLGPMGVGGDPGAQGAAGGAGGTGAPPAFNVYSVAQQDIILIGQNMVSQVLCETGDSVLSGGVYDLENKYGITQSFPTDGTASSAPADTADPNSTGTAGWAGSTEGGDIVIFAVCLDRTP